MSAYSVAGPPGPQGDPGPTGGLTAVTLTTKYRNSDAAGTVRFYNRFIAVTPIAIGG